MLRVILPYHGKRTTLSLAELCHLGPSVVLRQYYRLHLWPVTRDLYPTVWMRPNIRNCVCIIKGICETGVRDSCYTSAALEDNLTIAYRSQYTRTCSFEKFAPLSHIVLDFAWSTEVLKPKVLYSKRVILVSLIWYLLNGNDHSVAGEVTGHRLTGLCLPKSRNFHIPLLPNPVENPMNLIGYCSLCAKEGLWTQAINYECMLTKV